MFEKKCANGNYAAEGLQFVEEVTRFGISRGGRHALSESFFCQCATRKYKSACEGLQDGVRQRRNESGKADGLLDLFQAKLS